MATINVPAIGRAARSETYDGGMTVDYQPFPVGPGVASARLAKVRDAVSIISRFDDRIDAGDPCNTYFKNLPAGKTFRQHWRAGGLFIDFSPSTEIDFFGATHTNNQDIALSAWCLDANDRWTIAATIVHEVAHVGGAPGGESRAAERALFRCGFRPQYNPRVLGSIPAISRLLRSFA